MAEPADDSGAATVRCWCWRWGVPVQHCAQRPACAHAGERAHSVCVRGGERAGRTILAHSSLASTSAANGRVLRGTVIALQERRHRPATAAMHNSRVCTCRPLARALGRSHAKGRLERRAVRAQLNGGRVARAAAEGRGGGGGYCRRWSRSWAAARAYRRARRTCRTPPFAECSR